MSLAPRASRGALAVSLCRFALAARGPPNPPPPPLAPPFPRGAAPWLWLLASLALVLVAGMMAGLTVGLLGMDPIELELKKESEDPQTPAQREDRDGARAVWSVVSKHHWLLSTLLFVNAGANEALPLCLNELLPPYAVITVSVTLVLLFGEILPTAIFTGPRRLRIAAHCVPATRALMWATAPISFPMSLALDRAIGVGHHGETRLDRRQIGTLIGLHRRARRRGGGPPSAPPDDDSDAERALLGGGGADGSADASSSRPRPLGRFFFPRRFFVSSPAERGGAGGPSSSSSSSRVPPRRSLGHHRHAASFPALAASDRFPASASDSPPPRCGSLSEDEVQIVRQTLALSSKTVADAMTPLRSVKMLSQLDVVFDEDTLASTLGTGLSRIPVFRGDDVHNVVGVLMVRKLIVLDPNERRALRDVPLRAPLVAHPDAGLLETLNAFQAGRSHLALVTRHGARLRRAWREGRDVRPGSVEVLGVITVEDIVEELLGEEIRDEAEYGAELTHDGDDAREEERPRRRFGAGATNDAFEPTTPPEGGLRRETSPGEDDEPGDDETQTRARTSRLARGGSPYRLPAVRKAARKFKLLAERGRARRLQRSPSAESLAESLVSLRSLPATPRGAP